MLHDARPAQAGRGFQSDEKRDDQVSRFDRRVRVFTGRRALLVGGDGQSQFAVSKVLKKLGMTCDAAADGALALDMYVTSPEGHYDAIFINAAGGIAVADCKASADAIRACGHSDAKTVKIIALTGGGQGAEVPKELKNSVDGAVNVPIDPFELSNCLSRLLDMA